jgi:hypothetical protein
MKAIMQACLSTCKLASQFVEFLYPFQWLMICEKGEGVSIKKHLK